MQIFYAIEPGHDEGNGVCLVEAKTGKIIWSIGRPTKHVGDGMVADIDPSVPGLECFASEDSKGGSSDRYLFSAAGKPLAGGADVPPCRNWAFWDADLLREMIVGGGRGRGGAIAKYKGPTLASGIEGSVMMIADILGDWREEVITALPGELRIYTTAIPAADRRTCLMQDPVYRADVAHRSQGYDQSPVTSYYLGASPADAAKSAPTIPRAEK
jgi:rhamnogalacturonan endolyase